MFFSSMITSSFAILLGLSGSWIIYFPLIKVSEVFFLLSLQGIYCLSGDTVNTLATCLDIVERLGLSLLTFIYFSCPILVLLSDKLSDEIDLDLFIVFTMYYLSVLWEALDLSNNLDSSKNMYLFDSLLIYLSFLLCDAYGLSVLFTDSILFTPMRWVMAFSTTLGFVSISLIHYLTILYVVVNNGFLEDMILVIDLFYLVCTHSKN